MVSNFVLIYIEMGLPRLPIMDSFPLVSDLLGQWHQKSSTHKQKLFHLTWPILLQYQIIPIQERSQIPFLFLDADWEYLLECLMKIVMYTVPPQKKQKKQEEGYHGPFGRKVMAFVTNDGKAPWTHNSQELARVKVKILEFLSSDVIPSDKFLLKKYLFFLWASCDTYYELAQLGENGLKKFMKPDFEDMDNVKKVYALYRGNTQVDPDLDTYQIPAPLPVKIALLNHFFCKSFTAARCFLSAFPVGHDAIFSHEGTLKLKMAGMQFSFWIIRASGTNGGNEEDILYKTLDVIFSWYQTLISTSETPHALKQAAYEGMSCLCPKSPHLLAMKHKNLVQKLFRELAKADSNLAPCIQRAIAALSEAYKECFKELDQERRDELVVLLSKYSLQKGDACHYSALRFMNKVLPFYNHKICYLNLLSTRHERLDIRDEAFQGLVIPSRPFDGLTDGQMEQAGQDWLKTIPNLEIMARYVFDILQKKNPKDALLYPNSTILANALIFLYQLFIFHVNPFVDRQLLSSFIDADQLSCLDSETRRRAHVWMSQVTDFALVQVLEWILNNSSEFDELTISIASQMLTEFICLGNTKILNDFSSKMTSLSPFLGSHKPKTRLAMAHVLGILCTEPSHVQEFEPFLTKLIAILSSTDRAVSLDQKDGATLCLGFSIGRLFYRFHDRGEWRQFVKESIIYEGLEWIEKGLHSDSRETEKTCCYALAEACRYTQIQVCRNEIPWSVNAAIDKMMALSKTTQDNKLQEAIVYSLGHVTLGNPSVTLHVVEFLYSFSSGTNFEMYFTLGEVLSCIIFGYNVSLMDPYMDIPDIPLKSLSLNHSTEIFEKILDFIRPDQSPVVKRASAVWLLCLVKYGGKQTLIGNNLTRIHASFSLLLSDRDAFTQEVASKGIGLLYDLGDAKMKEDLVMSLVQMFSDGKKLAPQSVTSDTVLFDSLGSSPDGSSINTYQSVLSLAADLNQPDLVYKFMSLASHHAIWNSKKGASLGFGSIAIQAKHQLAPYLPKIIPKLYRYQFDPNPQVAKSMKDIWETLIPESNKTLSDFFPEIIKDLLAHVIDRQWRVREASCHAIADLIHARPLEVVEPFLLDLWNMCFRAIDDIKESVRVAGLKACKTLTQFTLKYTDVENATLKQGGHVLSLVIPFFLSKGLCSVSEDVKAFSLQTLLKICEKSGSLLKPFASDMICTLLEGLSQYEPQVMNYLAFHVEKYNVTQDQLETSRLHATKFSPMMNAIDRCLVQLDETILQDLIPKLCLIIRKGVGLPTKAGVFRVVSDLCNQFPREMEPHGPSLLKALSGSIQDRSFALKTAAATAIAHVAKSCPLDSLLSLVQFASKFYVESQDEDEKRITGVTFKELAKFAPDRVKSILGEVLPLTFLGLYDPVPVLKADWTAVWDELSAGPKSAARLWIPEILQLCLHLSQTSQSFGIKRQISKAIADLASVSGTSFDTSRETAFTLLLENMNGRTWEGKEDVNSALLNLAIDSKDWLVGSDLEEKVVSCLIKESLKRNRLYKRIAIENLGKLVGVLQADVYTRIKSDLFAMAKGTWTEDMDEDDPRDKPLLIAIRANAYKALGPIFLHGTRSQEEWKEMIKLFLSDLITNPWNIRLAITESLETILGPCTTLTSVLPCPLLFQLFDSLLQSLEDVKYSVLTEATIRVLELLKPWTEFMHQNDPNQWEALCQKAKSLSSLPASLKTLFHANASFL